MARTIFRHAAGVKITSRRGVGFLQRDDGEFHAIAKFERLKPSRASFVRSIMDHWADGNDKPHWWFHGFDQAEYRHCFVFKWDENRVHQRLYGFKCHPKPVTAKEFVLCVLVYYDTKTDATDYRILDRINRLLTGLEEAEAIAAEYTEYRGTHKWRQ